MQHLSIAIHALMRAQQIVFSCIHGQHEEQVIARQLISGVDFLFIAFAHLDAAMIEANAPMLRGFRADIEDGLLD